MDVKRAIAELGIDTAYNLRVVGDRLEFRLLGGRVLVWPADGYRGQPVDPPAPDFLLEPAGTLASDSTSTGSVCDVRGSVSEARPAEPDLLSWTREALREEAARAGIRGRGRMNKAELIEALRQAQGPGL